MPTDPAEHRITLASRRRRNMMTFRSECSCGEADHFWHNKAGLAHGWGDRHRENTNENKKE